MQPKHSQSVPQPHAIARFDDIAKSGRLKLEGQLCTSELDCGW